VNGTPRDTAEAAGQRRSPSRRSDGWRAYRRRGTPIAAAGTTRPATGRGDDHGMRLSINVTNFSWPGGAGRLGRELDRVVRAADDGGLDTVWVGDHLLQMEPGTDPAEPMLEAYTTLGWLAARTERVRLGTLVTAVSFRPPALLVKAVTTLDVLSGGRSWLGVGAGYQQQEARAIGLPLPPVAERFALLEETLRLADRMWSGDDRPYESAYLRLERPIGSPPPVRRPRVLIGGTGEKKTLRLVARYADACNVFDIPDGGRSIRHSLDVLARHCEDVGRPYDAIEKTVSTRLGPDETPDAFAARCADLAGLGIQHAVVLTSGPWTTEAVGRLAAAVPAVRDL
jgi:F420-dependent oxidoreductase-like protein